MTRPFNFSAGPAALPEPVLRQAADEMLDWHGSGMSVMEMSHRGKEFMSIHAQAEADLRELLAIPANYKVLFLQGGAIGENAIVPMNLLRGKTRADYVNTGDWSKKSIKEAQQFCTVNVAASAEAERLHRDAAARRAGGSTRRRLRAHLRQRDDRRRRVPLDARHRRRAAGRRHVVAHPVAADRRLALRPDLRRRAEEHRPGGPDDRDRRDDLLGQALPITPSAFDYKQQADNDSMLNTPPTYAIYIAGLVFHWLQARRAASRRWSEHNRAKAALLYDYLDAQRFYTQPVAHGRPLADERAASSCPTRRSTRLPRGRARRAACCS